MGRLYNLVLCMLGEILKAATRMAIDINEVSMTVSLLPLLSGLTAGLLPDDSALFLN